MARSGIDMTGTWEIRLTVLKPRSGGVKRHQGKRGFKQAVESVREKPKQEAEV